MRHIVLILIVCTMNPSLMMAKDRPKQLIQLKADFKRLQVFSGELNDMAGEMAQLQGDFGLKERGFYTSDEHDSLELLLFRYLLCRESLWDLINYYENYKTLFSEVENQAKGFLLGFSAAQHLAFYSSKLVATFLDEPQVIAKLNEAHYRSDIPKGTYDKLFQSVTSIKHLKALRTASRIFSEEFSSPDSTLSKLAVSDHEYRLLVIHTKKIMADADLNVMEVLRKKSILLPEVRNQIRHSEIISYIKKLRVGVKDNLYILRSVVFTNVSRLKSPLSLAIKFTSGQVETVKSMLQPGDIILTFKDGYMSNIFLPGIFKHGITYVGTPSERQAIGLTKEFLNGVPKRKQQKLLRDLATDTLPSGYQADLIEAVAEGVVFNSLENLLKDPITRLIVLRPRLNREERVKNLLTVFLLLGCNYDFKFDFNDATYQCCTEVIYRGLNNQGPIRFSLTKRMGQPTLSADDIIHYHLSAKSKPFECVLLASEDPGGSPNHAMIFPGDTGEMRLKNLMARR